MNFQDRIRSFAETAEKAAHEAVQKAGHLAHEKRDTVASGLDRVAAKVDERTEGKYADKVAKAKQQINRGVDRLADQRPGVATTAHPTDPTDPTTTEPPAATDANRHTGTLVDLPEPPDTTPPTTTDATPPAPQTVSEPPVETSSMPASEFPPAQRNDLDASIHELPKHEGPH